MFRTVIIVTLLTFSVVLIGSEVSGINPSGENGADQKKRELLLAEDFSEDWPPVGWEVTSTSGQINWQQGDDGAQFYGNPPNVAVQRLITPELDTSEYAAIFLMLTHLVNDHNGDYEIRLETRSDGGEWTTVVDFPSVNFGPLIDEIMILTDDVGSETFQIAWTFDGDSANINWWTIAYVEVIGINAGFIEGMVTLDGGEGDVTDVEVTAGNITVNPDEYGIYMIEIAPGSYDVIADLEYYYPQIIEDVVVAEDVVTDGVDFELEWILVLNPPQEISIDPETGEGTIEPPEPYPGTEFTHYNLYVDDTLEAQFEENYFDLTEWITLEIGHTYMIEVSAVYDLGESERVEIEYTYEGTDADEPIVSTTKLLGNYPNPFNPETNILFSLKSAGQVAIEIFNIKGEKIRSLTCEEFPAGNHTIVWDGKNDKGNIVSTGVYSYRMITDDQTDIKKMLLIK
jgi:hypothetical protein